MPVFTEVYKVFNLVSSRPLFQLKSPVSQELTGLSLCVGGKWGVKTCDLRTPVRMGGYYIAGTRRIFVTRNAVGSVSGGFLHGASVS